MIMLWPSAFTYVTKRVGYYLFGKLPDGGLITLASPYLFTIIDSFPLNDYSDAAMLILLDCSPIFI